ncbi:MADS-box transcription factor [Trema orientale]|uniref:MADS-box transcription factor n=1 Tax=Trema orientale TaxID=63057 RepID=A0A2P5BG92_TREOI|nr:MADS-box transcription factor [Trema orientale]
MTRKKLNLAYICNDWARKSTFKKRKKSLVKKLSELSTLCGIDACAIIRSPYEAEPEALPSAAGVQRVVAKFRKMPEMEQSKNMVNQQGFLSQRISKTSDQLKRLRNNNREWELRQVISQSLAGNYMRLESFNAMDLNDLRWLIDSDLKDIHKGIINNKMSSQMAAAPVAVAVDGGHTRGRESANAVAVAAEVMNLENSGMQRQQWSMDSMNNPQDHGHNHAQHMGFGGDEMNFPFGDNNQWSNGFFP